MTKMLLLLGFALGLTANAQSIIGGTDDGPFHGVSVVGTLADPMIMNHSTEPVISWALWRETDSGRSTRTVLDLDSLAHNRPIMPGQSRPALGLAGIFRTKSEAPATGYSLAAVLFADGSFVGPESLRTQVQEQVFELRSMARDTQYRSAKFELMEADRRILREEGKVNARTALADLLLGIRETDGYDEAETALSRLASLPDVKGENQ